MKTIVVYLVVGLLSMLTILYLLSWTDLINNKMLTGNILVDFKASFKDYIPSIYYFRYTIFIGTLILALLFCGVISIIKKMNL
jgi:hypothetical protein